MTKVFDMIKFVKSLRSSTDLDHFYPVLVKLAQKYCKNQISIMDLGTASVMTLDYIAAKLRYDDKDQLLIEVGHSIGLMTKPECKKLLDSYSSRGMIRSMERTSASRKIDYESAARIHQEDMLFRLHKPTKEEPWIMGNSKESTDSVMPQFSDVLKILMMLKYMAIKHTNNMKEVKNGVKPHYEKFMKIFHKYSKNHDDTNNTITL